MTERKQLYVTSTEELYPSETNFGNVIIRLYCRDEEGEYVPVTVRKFEPYFYVREEETDDVLPAKVENLDRYEETDFIPLEDRYVGDIPGVEPQNLVKAVAEYPGAITNLRKRFEKTWSADTLFTERFRIDKDITTGISVPESAKKGDKYVVTPDEIEPEEVTDVEPRVMTFDIETDDRGTGFPEPGDARILSIVAHDSYDDEYVAFLDTNGRSIEQHFGLDEAPESLDELGLDEVDRLNFEPSERRMLIAFASWVNDKNPDIITGWNSGDSSADGFDLPHVIERMAEVGANPTRLSREGEVEVDERGDDYIPSITGRACYDLMDGWLDTKFTSQRSSRLDYVAAKELDDEKVPHPEMGYYEMYREDPVKFLNYNAKDTRLTVEINDAANILGFKKRLKDMVGVDWRRTHENNEFIEMSVRRKCREHGLAMVTAWSNPNVIEAFENKSDGVNYEGAHVEDAFEGVKKNVCGVDLASLYPMTQWMLNASPDTKIRCEPGSERWEKLMKAVGFDGRTGQFRYVKSANEVCFRNDKDSIIRELVDDYHELKAEFKAKRNAAEYGTDEWDEMAEAYNVTKTIYNSYYGYTGWDRSPLYDPDIAAAVTLTGQRVIKRTTEFIAEETRGEVVYGDTDSNYVEFPSEWGQVKTLDTAKDICDKLTNDVYEDLCGEFFIPTEQNRWEIEVEMRAHRFFMSGSKKHYTYLKTWDEGDDHGDVVGTDLPASEVDWEDGEFGKYSVTGYPPVKSNFSTLTKETTDAVLEGIVRGMEKTEIVDIVHDAACSIDAEDPDWERLGMPQGLGNKFEAGRGDEDGYYKFTDGTPKGAHPRGAYFANNIEEMPVEFGQGDKPMRTYLKPTLTVEGENGEEHLVDVIGYEEAADLDPIEEDLKMDVTAMQNKTLYNPLEDILDCYGVEPKAALQGRTEEQSGLGAFM